MRHFNRPISPRRNILNGIYFVIPPEISRNRRKKKIERTRKEDDVWSFFCVLLAVMYHKEMEEKRNLCENKMKEQVKRVKATATNRDEN